MSTATAAATHESLGGELVPDSTTTKVGESDTVSGAMRITASPLCRVKKPLNRFTARDQPLADFVGFQTDAADASLMPAEHGRKTSSAVGDVITDFAERTDGFLQQMRIRRRPTFFCSGHVFPFAAGTHARKKGSVFLTML